MFFKLKEGATRPTAREAPCTRTAELFPLALAAVSSTLYSSTLRKHKNTYKNTTKLSNGIKVYENTSIRKVNVITQKRGIIQTVLTKSIDKCHYLHTQNNYNLALNNSPQLESVCPQTGPNTQIAKVKIQRIKNRQDLEKQNNCTVQTKTYEQSKYLPLSYNDNMKTKRIISTKIHTKHPKTKQTQK